MATQTHFFASFGLGWVTAETKHEAITNLVRAFRSEFKKMAANQIKENKPGAYFWICEVDAPADASYSINFYMPEGVTILNSDDGYITRVTATDFNSFLVSDVTR
jgi:hypothetical protein